MACIVSIGVRVLLYNAGVGLLNKYLQVQRITPRVPRPSLSGNVDVKSERVSYMLTMLNISIWMDEQNGQ